MKYEAIAKYSQEFSVRKMCAVLGLAAQAYYQWRRREAKRREKREAERGLVERIREILREIAGPTATGPCSAPWQNKTSSCASTRCGG